MKAFLLVAIFSIVHGLIPTGYISPADKLRIKSILDSSASPKISDVSSANHLLNSYKLLATKSSKPSEDCKFLKDNVDANSAESIFHATEAAKALDGCKVTVSTAKNVLAKAIEGATTQTLLYVVASSKNLGIPVDSKKVSAALNAALKKDDSLTSLGYAFHAASMLDGDVNAFFDRIEDVGVQADEVDGKYLQFEGGIGVTAMIISGIYRLSDTAKKAPPMTNDQVSKFTNYLLNRKTTRSLRGLHYLLDSLKILANNKYHVPISITLASDVALSKTNPVIKIRVTDVLGQAVSGKLTVTADTVTRTKDGAVIMSKEAFTEVKGDGSQYEINLSKKLKNLIGTHKFAVSAVPKKADARLIGNVGSPVTVNFLVETALENVEVGTAELDQSASAVMKKASFPSKLQSQLAADTHQRIVMKFNLKNKDSNKAFSAHQVFLQLTNKKTNQEITFVHEHNAQGNYKFDIDLKAKASDFGHLSGVYSMVVVIGDSFSSNSFNWQLADIALSFGDDTIVKESESIYAMKPEIKHKFREPEKRPSELVSNFFTGLVFVPIVVLFILWIKIGANISNFPISLSAICFHLSLAGAFFLFFTFWMRLNMFVTVKCLIALGIVIFLSGNRLLSSLAKKK